MIEAAIKHQERKVRHLIQISKEKKKNLFQTNDKCSFKQLLYGDNGKLSNLR